MVTIGYLFVTTQHHKLITRAQMPDYLRLIALFGIVVVNVQFMAFPDSANFPFNTGFSGFDRVTVLLVNGLALTKSYGLFSFMFGVGLGFLMQSVERRGLPFGRVYRNRMIGLLVLGLLHGCLFFFGDILVIYAVTGSILYLMRNWAVRRLVKWGVVLLVLQTAIVAATMLAALFVDPAVTAEHDAWAKTVMTTGGIADVIQYRSSEYLFFLPFGLMFQGLGALGWFCLGLASVRSGMIDNPDHQQWKNARRICLVPGVAGSLLGAVLVLNGHSIWGIVLVVVAAPVATVGYLGLIAAMPKPKSRMAKTILAAGGASLSVYLGQSIILSWIFSGYGLGLWSGVSWTVATGTALLVTAFLIASVAMWQSRFGTPPFERLLRRITYAGSRG